MLESINKGSRGESRRRLFRISHLGVLTCVCACVVCACVCVEFVLYSGGPVESGR